MSKERIAIYPGSFDPLTNGHLDIICRASKLFDKLIVGVLHNDAKKCLFTMEERAALISKCIGDMPNVSVQTFNGLLVDFVKQKKSNIIIRGLRALTDFDLEMQMAQGNRVVAPDVDTVFLSTSVQYSYLSSSVVKEYARYGVDLKEFVPECVIPQLIDKIK